MSGDGGLYPNLPALSFLHLSRSFLSFSIHVCQSSYDSFNMSVSKWLHFLLTLQNNEPQYGFNVHFNDFYVAKI